MRLKYEWEEPKKYKYYSVFEYYAGKDGRPEKRRVYTFDNESAANDLVEFIIQHDFMKPALAVEEHEATT